jgi:hypothetical protein
MCAEHWASLREKIKAAGLETLVPETGEEAAQKLAESLSGVETTIDNYDPLMSAYMAIMTNGLETAGLAIMGDTDCNGDPCDCVICKLNTWHARDCLIVHPEQPCTFSYDPWLDNAVADEVERMKAMGNG